MHVKSVSALNDFNMHLLITLPNYEYLSYAPLLSIIYLVTIEYYHCI